MKLKVQPDLFFVGTVSGRIVATVMAGYDGHHGQIIDPAAVPVIAGHNRCHDTTADGAHKKQVGLDLEFHFDIFFRFILRDHQVTAMP